MENQVEISYDHNQEFWDQCIDNAEILYQRGEQDIYKIL